MTKIGIISLGCPRNQVDTEVMMGLLRNDGFSVSEGVEGCDIALINTCSFIKDAKEESIEIILEAEELKKRGDLKAIVVAGCLPQRYRSELNGTLKAVDGFLGVGDVEKIPELIKKILKGKRAKIISRTPEYLYSDTSPRISLTPPHYIYVKLSEGCSNNCSYCVIPKLRGKLRSRPIDSVVREVEMAAESRKLSEINLIGQDITNYGVDRSGNPELTTLLKRLVKLKSTPWIRLLYTHPAHYEDGLIDLVANEEVICKYLDIPFQHISDTVLKRMKRKVARKDIEVLIKKVRKAIPELSIRTTFIVGFPGETDKEFEELRNFVSDMKFERMGIFTYSREEGSPAYKFPKQVSEKVKKERFDELMRLQQDISVENNNQFLGKTIEVLIDEKREKNSPFILGRTQADAPEVDGTVYVNSKKQLRSGDFVPVKITDTLEYDLVGELYEPGK